MCSSDLGQIRGRLSSLIKVEHGWEAAVAAALGPLADSIVVGDMRSAVSALTLLKNESAGQSELLVVDGSQESANFTMPAGVTPLYQLISSDGLDNALRYLLARYVAVRDLDAAQSLLSFDPALIAVTQDGDLVRDRKSTRLNSSH